MKLVSEHINEKFTSESDPIEDMHIGVSGLLASFVEELKQETYDMNWYNQFNNDDDLLWICAGYNKFELVKYLLNKGANIHHKSDRALRWATYKGNYEIVQFLLNNGANVNNYDSGAYKLAKDAGNIEILDLLKRHGATPPKGNRPELEEKFTEKSDPVTDLGIGVISTLKPLSILRCKKRIRPRLSYIGANFKFYIKPGDYSAIKQIHTDDENIVLELSTYEKYPKFLNASDLKFMGGEYLTLTKDEFFEHFEIVKKPINEKFEEESDPVHDLGIGLRAIYDNIKEGDIFILKKDIPTLGKIYVKGAYLRVHSVTNRPDYDYDKLINYSLYLNKKDFKNNVDVECYIDWGWNYDFFKDYFIVANIKESINEKFEEDSDPIHDMGIGLRAIWNNLKGGDLFRFKRTLEITRDGVPTGKIYEKGTYIVILNVKEENINNKEITFNHYNTTNLNNLYDNKAEYSNYWTWSYEFFVKYFELVSTKYIKESLNEKFEEDDDPIHSMGIGMDRIIKDWIEKDLNMDYNQQKNYILQICATHNKLDFIKYLIEKTPDNTVKRYDKNAALESAAAHGYLEIVKYLLEKGADPTHNDNFAIRWAAREGYYDIVKLLLVSGADPKAKGNYALNVAKYYGHKNIVKLLSKFNSDFNNIKESLNEKFKEDSDPIKDLQIGMQEINFKEIRDSIWADGTSMMNKNYFSNLNKWTTFMSSLTGKTIIGKFEYPRKSISIKIKEIRSFDSGHDIYITNMENYKYKVINSETYMVSK